MHPEFRQLQPIYKLIAVIGISAVAAPYFQLFAVGVVENSALSFLIMLTLYPLLIFVGYGIQLLLRGKNKTSRDVNFHFEIGMKSEIPLAKRALACILSAVAGGGLMGLIATAVIPMTTLGQYQHMIAWFYFYCILFGIGSAVMGAILCGVRFNKLIGIRSFVECAAVLGIYLGISIGVFGYVSIFVTFCTAVYLFCFMLENQQEAMCRAVSVSDTCHMSISLFWSGVRQIMQIWVQILALNIVLLSFYQLLVTIVLFGTGLSALKAANSTDPVKWRAIFRGIPSATDYPYLNVILFLMGIVFVLGLVIFALLRRRLKKDWHVALTWRLLGRAVTGIVLFLQKLFVNWHFVGVKKTKPKEEKITDYTDTVKRIPVAKRKKPLTYVTFVRRLRGMSDPREQFRYAYRTFLLSMVEKNIGVETHSTPNEASRIICEKTVYHETERLTAMFLRLTYAKDSSDADAEVNAGTAILCEYLQKCMAS